MVGEVIYLRYFLLLKITLFIIKITFIIKNNLSHYQNSVA